MLTTREQDATGGRAAALASVSGARMIHFIPSPNGAILTSSKDRAGKKEDDITFVINPTQKQKKKISKQITCN